MSSRKAPNRSRKAPPSKAARKPRTGGSRGPSAAPHPGSGSRRNVGSRSTSAARDRRTVGGEQVEGRHAVLELLMAGARRVQEVWIDSGTEGAAIVQDIRELAEANRVPVREVGRSKFTARARCEAPQGVLALAAELPDHSLDDLVSGKRLPGHTSLPRSGERSTAPFLVALDGVTDPGNLGAVLRSAEGAGASGVILPRHRAVNVTPAAAKAAAGAIEHLPISLVGGLPGALTQLSDRDVLTIGLDGSAGAPLHELPPVDGPVCLVLGAEGRGLSRLVRQRCDVLTRIPLHGQLASLNVSAATAVACFEIARRRHDG